tara:strand:+ start:1045 stop:2403 length:1359 start_codon:yes stop_codon:yes gene_type:complete
MSAMVQMSNIPFVQWKGQTFDQIQSFIRKNNVDTAYEPDTNRSKFRANPLKIYRREVATHQSANCNVRTSVSVDVFNQPGGTIINSSSTTTNGLVNTIDNNLPNNTCETYTNCSVITSPAENARRRVRSGGMIKKKFDSSRNTDNYFTTSKQYLASRNSTFEQNQYNYIRMGDSSSKPGTSLASNNLYSPNGLNHCKKYFISADTTIGYEWIDGNSFSVSVPSGYYYLSEINELLKNTMISNHHYYTKNQVGLNPDPYRDVLTFLLNISYNNNDDVVELQSFRTSTTVHPDATYTVSSDATWTKPVTSIYPQFTISTSLMQAALGIPQASYPLITNSTTSLFQTKQSETTPGLQPNYRKLYYKPNNPQFAKQGAVSSSDLITRKRYNSITNSAVIYYNSLGQSVGNALAYGVPVGGYTVKDKMGFPMKKTPTFSKYSDEMKKCTVTKISNQI